MNNEEKNIENLEAQIKELKAELKFYKEKRDLTSIWSYAEIKPIEEIVITSKGIEYNPGRHNGSKQANRIRLLAKDIFFGDNYEEVAVRMEEKAAGILRIESINNLSDKDMTYEQKALAGEFASKMSELFNEYVKKANGDEEQLKEKMRKANKIRERYSASPLLREKFGTL